MIDDPEFRARLYRRIDIDLFPNPRTGTPCWIWKGAITTHGYGEIRPPHSGNPIKTHIATFIIERGPIPTGKELDHICRNRRCCNPAHLEPVSHRLNAQRGHHDAPRRPRPRPRKSDKRTLQLPFES